MLKFFDSLWKPRLAISAFAALVSVSCSKGPPERVHFGGNSANATAGSPTNPSGGGSGNGSVGLTSQKFRGLSSVEIRNAVLDIYGVSIDSILGDHPPEDGDTGFFNSIYTYSMTAPRAKWMSDQAALVASKITLTSPALKGLTACAATDAACLETNITKLATQTYRRVPSKAEVTALLASITKVGAKTYLEQVSIAVEIMLQSPQFAMHAEAANASGKLNASYAVAARLASMLWQSSPDAALLDAAAKGGLLDEASIKPHVTRMLSDPKAARGLGQFVKEWLGLYTFTRRDLTEAQAAGVTASVLEGMVLETQQTFTAAALTPNGDFLEGLFVPEKTFLTADLAKFYGVSVPAGTAKDPVAVTIAADSPRRGLLTQASYMFVTTKRSSTSLITRGNGVYGTFLCRSAGAPSEDDLAEAAKDAAVARSKRDESTFRMGKKDCGPCHQQFDPIGLALEGFDFVGKTRTVDEKKDPINTKASFILDGKLTEFSDVLAMSAAFAKSSDVASCVSKRMIDYAYAGNLKDPQKEVLAKVTKAFQDSGHSFEALVLATLSQPEFFEP